MTEDILGAVWRDQAERFGLLAAAFLHWLETAVKSFQIQDWHFDRRGPGIAVIAAQKKSVKPPGAIDVSCYDDNGVGADATHRRTLSHRIRRRDQ